MKDILIAHAIEKLLEHSIGVGYSGSIPKWLEIYLSNAESAGAYTGPTSGDAYKALSLWRRQMSLNVVPGLKKGRGRRPLPLPRITKVEEVEFGRESRLFLRGLSKTGKRKVILLRTERSSLVDIDWAKKQFLEKLNNE